MNNQCPEVDKMFNGNQYEKENINTGVIYEILNVTNCKSYIGKAFSYGKNGNKHGAFNRFKKHWERANGNNIKSRNDCPIFYEALRNSYINDWFIFILKVCLKRHERI